MMRAVTLEVGKFLPMDTVPDGGNLALVHTAEGREAIGLALSVPASSFSAALVNIKGDKYETVWLCNEKNPFELTSAYCLVRHNKEVV
ncbi:hypothetical protein LP417_35120 (plasmid) [Polaromonas sp. P1-6]|nr:hypothetical protein LP417_35120 [Polaromonas sp. P1-6]